MDSGDNIHDKLFRTALSDQGLAADFLQNYLPEGILGRLCLDTLAIRKDSFVDASQKDLRSDLLYEVRFSNDELGFVYFLFEHKSSPDRFVALQLLKYMLEIWELYRKQNKRQRLKTLPLVIPIVIYHGRKPQQAWRLAELVSAPAEELKACVPDFSMLFHDFSPGSEEHIKGAILVRLVLSCLRAKNEPRNVQHVARIFQLLAELDDSASSMHWVEVIFRYVSQVMDIETEDLHTVAQKALTEGKEGAIMNLAERLRQEGLKEGALIGEERGIKLGEERGLRKGRCATLERLLRARFGAAFTSRHLDRLQGASLEQLDHWTESILHAESIDELFDAD